MINVIQPSSYFSAEALLNLDPLHFSLGAKNSALHYSCIIDLLYGRLWAFDIMTTKLVLH